MNSLRIYQLCCFAMIPAMIAQNLIVNPSFDTTENKIANWTITRADSKRCHVSASEGVLKLSNTPETFCRLSQDLPLIKGKTYKFSIMHRSLARSASRFAILMSPTLTYSSIWRSEERKTGLDLLPLPQFCTRDWQEYNVEFIAQANRGRLVIGAATQGDFQFKTPTLVKLNRNKATTPIRASGWYGDSTNLWMAKENTLTVHGAQATKPIRLRHVSIELEAGERYNLTYNARSHGQSTSLDNGYHYRFFLTWPGSRQVDGNSDQALLQADHSYQRSLTFTVPLNTATNQLILNVICPPGNDVVFSDFNVKKLPQPIVPLKITFTQPSYGQAIYASLPQKEIKGIITLTSAEKATLFFKKQDGSIIWQQTFDKNGIFTVPVGKLPYGNYRFTAISQSRHGKTLPEVNKTFRKLPPAPMEVVIDQDKDFRINGRKFFLISAGHATLGNIAASYQFLSQNGINTLGYDLVDKPQKLLQLLDLANQVGIKLKIATKFPKSLEQKDLNDWETYFKQVFTPTVRNHPAFLMYAIADEPQCVGCSVEVLKWTYNFIRDFDPYHPIALNEAPGGLIQELMPYGECCDADGVDIYPIPEGNPHIGTRNKTLSCIGDYVRKMRAVVEDRKPIVMTLQAFSWGDLTGKSTPIYPTLRQQRFMLYDAMLSGAKGLSFWGMAYVKDNHYFTHALFPVIREARAMSQAFLNEEFSECQTIVPKSPVRVYAKTCGQQHFLIAINTTGKPCHARISTTSMTDPMLHVLFEYRTVISQKHEIMDDFEPYDVHVYSNLPTIAGNACQSATPTVGTDSVPLNKYFGKFVNNANWLSGHHGYPEVAQLFSKSLTLKRLPKQAVLTVTGNPQMAVYVNGSPALVGTAGTLSIRHLLKIGENQVHLEVKHQKITPPTVMTLTTDGENILTIREQP